MMGHWFSDLLIRRRYADISTSQLEKFRDHAAEHGLDASREHYEAILTARNRCWLRKKSR